MGGAQSNNKRSLFSCVKFLIDDIDLYTDDKLLNQLREIQIKFPCNFEKKKKKVIKFLSKSIPPQISQFDDILIDNISSVFQCSLIQNKYNKNKQFENLKLDPDFIRNFRLMNFKELKTNYEGEYENSLILLYQGLKSYCYLANWIIVELNNNVKIQSWIYVLIWEHFQNHLVKISKDPDFDLTPINKSFDEKFYQLSPELRIEIVGAKIWGTTVQQLDTKFILNEFKIARRLNNEQQLPFNQIFNAIIDINIDVANLQWIGISDFLFSDQLKEIINFLQQDSKALMDNLLIESRGDLLMFFEKWEKDNKFLKFSLPLWICENQIDQPFFEYCEEQIRQNFKLQTQVVQKNLIEKYSSSYCYSQTIEGFQQQQFNSNIFQFDATKKESFHSTLQKMVNWLKKENQFSSILVSQSTQQGNSAAINHNDVFNFESEENNQQENSTVKVQSMIQSLNSQSNMITEEEEELIKICNKFDTIKKNIQSSIEYRDQNILFRNRGLIPISEQLIDFFSFIKPITEEYVKKIIIYIVSQKQNEKPLINNPFENKLEFNMGSVAAQLLFLDN